MHRSSLARRAALAGMLGLLICAPALGQEASPSAPPALPQLPDTIIGVVTDPVSRQPGGMADAMASAAVEVGKGIGAAPVRVVTPRNTDGILPAVRALAEEGAYIVVVGSQGKSATLLAAGENPVVRFIGVGQGPKTCIDASGQPDATGECVGDPLTLRPNYVATSYREDQAGYLAGIVAASASRTGRLGAIAGVPGCAPCARFINGFELGARSVDPDVEIFKATVTDTDPVAGLDDPETGRLFADAFIDVFEPDVVVAAADRTGLGILRAACEAGILGIGSGVDQALADRKAADCTLTSGDLGIGQSVTDNILAIAGLTPKAGSDIWDVNRLGFGLAPFYELASRLPVDVPGRLADAVSGMQQGTIETCPAGCETLTDLVTEPAEPPAG